MNGEKQKSSKLPLAEIKTPEMPKKLASNGKTETEISKKLASNEKTELTVPKPLIPPEIRQKLAKYSFSRHFNSETVTGRANVRN